LMKSLENFLKILKNLLGLHAPPQPALHEGLAHHQAYLPKMGQRFHIRTEPLPVAPSKTPSFCTITEKRLMSAVMQSRGQFVSSHFDCSSYTMQGKHNLANLTMPFSSPGQVISKAISLSAAARKR